MEEYNLNTFKNQRTSSSAGGGNMTLNRKQEGLIALKVIHALERAIGSKIPTQKRAKLKQFKGTGMGITLKNGCGELALEARGMRVDRLEV